VNAPWVKYSTMLAVQELDTLNPKEKAKRPKEFPCLLGGHFMACDYPSLKKKRGTLNLLFRSGRDLTITTYKHKCRPHYFENVTTLGLLSKAINHVLHDRCSRPFLWYVHLFFSVFFLQNFMTCKSITYLFFFFFFFGWPNITKNFL